MIRTTRMAVIATTLAVLVAASVASPAGATDPSPPDGAINPSGSLADGRIFHTATLLRDGRVLITGGTAKRLMLPYISPLASAGLYDPATGLISSAAPMSTSRIAHTATLLADGRVLVIGGSRDGSVDCCASAELFDPVTGIFTSTGPMAAARSGHTATRLGDGRVLVVGGSDEEASMPAELYDPASGTFSLTGAPRLAHGYGHSATALQDGRVLVVGGSDALASAELFDRASGTFVVTGGLGAPRQGHDATLLRDGRVLVTGGLSGAGQPVFSGDPGIAAMEIYDPRRGVFTSAGTLPDARSGQTASLLPDGRVLIAGGWVKVSSAEGFQPVVAGTLVDATDLTQTVAGPMARPRGLHTATSLLDGRVLLVGGIADPPVSAEVYDPATDAFALVDPESTGVP